MINPITNERELCYVVKVDSIEPIPGRDRVEAAIVSGWKTMVRKGQFHPGSLGIYFEIDSQVPEKEPFMFLAAKKFKIKTQKYKTPDGQFWSQGLLMGAEDFGWTTAERESDTCSTCIVDSDGMAHYVDDESRFLTKQLNVTYAVAEDNARKSGSMDKYKKMVQRHPKLFAKKPIRWLMRRDWGKKLLFILFGKKKDKKTGFPTHFPFVHRSDEERVECMPWILEDKEPWVKTLKIDGTSSTYILEKKGKHKFEEYVCSRNVRQLTPSQKNYHTDIEGNVYWMMADKYKIFDFLKSYLIENNLNYVCLQGETAGPSLQGNPHKLKEICFFGYNFIRSDTGRMNSIEAAKICNAADIPWVPIADEAYILPDDMETLKLDADGPCLVGEGPREGWVYRSLDGQRSFKNVSRQYLLKH